MSFHIMTDGTHILVSNKWGVDYYESNGWTKVGNSFDDWKQANKQADQLALALG